MTDRLRCGGCNADLGELDNTEDELELRSAGECPHCSETMEVICRECGWVGPESDVNDAGDPDEPTCPSCGGVDVDVL